MNVALNVPSILLASFGAYVVMFNYGALIVNSRNVKQGINHLVSFGYILPQLSLLLAYAASFLPSRNFVPGWLLFTIGAADVSLWCLVAFPFVLLFTRIRS